MKLILTITALFLGYLIGEYDASAQANEPYVIEWHHTQYVFPRDDIGLKRITIEDIERMI